MATDENVPDATVTSTVNPVPLPPVVAVCVYVPSVYPDPVPVTVSVITSPKDLTAAELLFATTFCLTLNFPASKLPENVAVPVDVSNLNTSVVPSSTIRSTSVPPLNVKSPPPLVSKVKGLLRRSKKNHEREIEEIQFGNFKINRDKYKVYVDDKSISLPKKEFELLSLLSSKPDKVFKREKIMEKVWGEKVIVGDRTIDVHIRKLREKIGDKYFKTIKGVGYKFIIEE